MSIDLDWTKLNSSLASYLVEVLNRQLSNAERPSFIGPIEVTSLDFGSTAPDVELVEMRDIYRDFLEDENEGDRGPVKVSEGVEDEDGFEWVSRRAAGREEGLAYQHLPPHIRYGRGGPTDFYASVPAPTYSPSLTSAEFKPQFNSWDPPIYRSPSPSTPFTTGHPHRKEGSHYEQNEISLNIPLQGPSAFLPHQGTPSASPDDPLPVPHAEHPNLQLHLHVNWHSDLRVTLTTSLLINYPSPMFMSLPIKLSVTGLIFNGELTVAYEGERRRVHICILDDLDPYGPAGDRHKRDSTSSTPPELDYEASPRPTKPLPVGQRLLPSIFIESEIGQADKHVLKNVTRVERFIQDVIRKTVEEELVFPNFHTLLMGDQ